MALIYVWLRLSTMKQLDWHRGSSYQSKDIAHAQKTIAQRMADKVCTQHRARQMITTASWRARSFLKIRAGLHTESRQGGPLLLLVWA